MDAPVAYLGAAMFVEASGLGAVFPLLARIQAAHHLATWTLGLLSAASFLAAVAAQVGVSRLLDGARARWVLLAGLLTGGGALIWFALAGDLWQLVASRALLGVSFGIVEPAALREAAVGAEGERRGQRLGIIGSCMMAGIVVGPLLGTLLARLGGLALPFESLGGLMAVLAVAAPLVPRRVAQGEDAGDVRTAMPKLGSRPVIAVLLLAAASQLPTGFYDSLWSRLLTDRGASSLLIGLSLTVFGIPFMVFAPFGGRMAERRGPLLAASIGMVIAAAFMAVYGVIPSPVVVILLGVGESCAQCLAIPGGFAAVARVFPESNAAAGQGLYAGAGTATAGLTALAAAPIYSAFGGGTAFGLGAAMSACLALSALAIGRGSQLGPAVPAPAPDVPAGRPSQEAHPACP